MNHHEQLKKFRSLELWLQSPQGRSVGSAFVEQMQALPLSLKGDIALQLGYFQQLQLIPTSYKKQWLLSPFPCPKAHVIGSYSHLPFDQDSVDCIIAPLVLEAFSKLNNPLSEIERVLKPMGYLVFFAINPWSLWGLYAKLGWLKCYPDTFHLISALSLQYDLITRGFTPAFNQGFYYTPPASTPYWISRFHFFNEMGKMLWPIPGGFYCLVVQKRQLALPRFQRFRPAPLFDLEHTF